MSDSGKNGEQPSALERYLAKQKSLKNDPQKPTTRGWAKAANQPASAPTPAKPTQQTQSPGQPVTADRGIEYGAPAAPPPQPPKVEIEAGVDREPGDMGSRIVAVLIDLCIVSALAWPVHTVVLGILGLISSGLVDFASSSIRFLSWYGIVFAYYGWFYTKKGASPGKLLMGLEVIDSSDGGRVSYWKAFFREAVGKWISLIPLGIGYLTAFFRPDHKALHDLLFDTMVVRGASARNKT